MSEILKFRATNFKDNDLWRDIIENVQDNIYFALNDIKDDLFTFTNQERQKLSFIIISTLKIMIIDIDK